MRDHLSQAREHRAGLREAIGDVERALAGPAGNRYEPWGKELAHELDVLGEALERHIMATEAPAFGSSPRLIHFLDSPAMASVRFLATAGLVLGVAELAHQYIELPCIQIGKRVAARAARGAVVAAT